MGNNCECECMENLKDSVLDKIGSSNPYMEPNSYITIEETTPGDFQVLDNLTQCTSIGKIKGIPKDNYFLKFKISDNPTGRIYLVKRKDTGELRSIKILTKKSKEMKKLTPQLLKEIENLEKINHPNILKLYEVYENENFFSYVSEYCEGVSLSMNIKDYRNKSEVIIACIMYQIFLTLNYCHQNKISHTCLNPEFILIKNKLNKGYPDVKIYGFGLIKAYMDNPNQTDYSPNYFAPEVLLDLYNEKCDLWSCGVILYVLLSGKYPFKGKTADQVHQKIKQGLFRMDSVFFKHVSPSAKDLISKLIKVNPEERLTAETALQHEWFKELKIKEKLTQIKASVIRKLFSSVNKFRITNPLQIPTLDYLKKYVATPEQVEIASKLFTILDTNNEGIVTKGQFFSKIPEIFEEQGEKITSEELERVFEILDFDGKNSGKGKLSFKEFSIALSNKNTLLKEECLEKAFAYFVKGNNNKKISLDEIRATFRNDNAYSEYDFKEVMKKADIKHDGEIDYSEFRQMIAEIVIG